MRYITFPKFLYSLVFAALLACGAIAQDGPPVRAADARFGQPGPPADARPQLLLELGLSREQVDAVRRLNEDRKPLEMAARRRSQEAGRMLNMAIYSDSVDENEFRARLSEFQAAQAELARIKFTNELAIRKILTPVQLMRFRELRRKFAEERREMRGEEAPPIRPFRRGGRRQF